MTNAGETSRLDLARRICDLAGIDRDRITPVDPPPSRAPRPRYSVLASERLPHLEIEPLRSWEVALTEMMAGSQRPTTD